MQHFADLENWDVPVRAGYDNDRTGPGHCEVGNSGEKGLTTIVRSWCKRMSGTEILGANAHIYITAVASMGKQEYEHCK